MYPPLPLFLSHQSIVPNRFDFAALLSVAAQSNAKEAALLLFSSSFQIDLLISTALLCGLALRSLLAIGT